MNDVPEGPLKRGWTTGACAAAGARAAFTALLDGEFPDPVTISLPGGQSPSFPLARHKFDGDTAEVSIVKDAGDDPDVTHGALVVVRVRLDRAGRGVSFKGGEGVGTVTFWITGNSVNGDGGLGNVIEDMWNQLTFALVEGDEDSLARGTRTVFAGDGDVAPPEPESHGADLHHMGAKLRAHWLGLLGFGAVIMCVVFAGLMLRYGFSTSYEGRSNQLRLRYKLMRRGDQ